VQQYRRPSGLITKLILYIDMYTIYIHTARRGVNDKNETEGGKKTIIIIIITKIGDRERETKRHRRHCVHAAKGLQAKDDSQFVLDGGEDVLRINVRRCTRGQSDGSYTFVLSYYYFGRNDFSPDRNNYTTPNKKKRKSHFQRNSSAVQRRSGA